LDVVSINHNKAHQGTSKELKPCSSISTGTVGHGTSHSPTV